MRAKRGRIENLVMRIQSEFLNTPWLALTVPSAQRRFDIDDVTSEAVLEALADAHVLSRSRQGVYVRWFPEVTTRRPRVHGGRHVAPHAA